MTRGLLLVGDRINATRKSVAEALKEKDRDFIQREARRQAESGADVLDLNCGTGANERDLMAWMVDAVSEVTDKPLFLDSSDSSVIEQGLARAKDPTRCVANSTPFVSERLDSLLPVVKQYKCGVLGLCMDQNGIPSDAEGRVEIAKKLLDAFDREQIPPERVYLDPMTEPVATGAEHGIRTLEAAREIRALAPGIRISVSLSGISFGLPQRRWLNRAFLPALLYAGVDVIMLDPLDRDLMRLVRASQAVLGMDDFCLRYITAYRAGELDSGNT